MSTQVQFDARVLRKTTAAEDAQADLDALIIPGIVDAVTTPDLKFVKIGASGSTISYESSDQNVITNAGKVLGIGYAEDQSITLNVQAEKNGSVAEKQFTIIVKSVNLTYDKYATASSNGIGFAAIYAIDQDEETAWLSNDEEMRPSITVDLYQPMKLNQIRLKGIGNSVKSAKLEYSLNNISYQPLLTLTSPGSEMKLFNVDTVQARYLRYTITDKTLESAGLSELQAYYKEDVSSIFDSAVSAITIPNRHSITESFTLPVPPEGYHVTWTSDTPEVIRIEGNRAVVVRKSNDVTVTLTAVLEYDGLTCVKEFDDCRVLGTSSGGSSAGGGGGGGSSIISGNNSSQGSVYLPVENIQNETNRFADVPETHWAYAYIQRLAENGVMNGRSVEYFAPDDPITREEFVKLLIAGFGFSVSVAETGFSDVDENAWYAPRRNWGL